MPLGEVLLFLSKTSYSSATIRYCFEQHASTDGHAFTALAESLSPNVFGLRTHLGACASGHRTAGRRAMPAPRRTEVQGHMASVLG